MIGTFLVAVHKNIPPRKIRLDINWLLIVSDKIKFFKKSITAINGYKKNKNIKGDFKITELIVLIIRIAS